MESMPTDMFKVERDQLSEPEYHRWLQVPSKRGRPRVAVSQALKHARVAEAGWVVRRGGAG